MIRLIFESHVCDCSSGENAKDYHTLAVDLPEVERLLMQGGSGPQGFDRTRLVGAEIVPDNAAVSANAEHCVVVETPNEEDLP